MRYVIVKHDLKEDGNSFKEEKYLLKVSINKFGIPEKSWTKYVGEAISWSDLNLANHVKSLLAINSPYPLVVEATELSIYEPFKPKHLREIQNGKLELFFKDAREYYPAKIICADRRGVKNNSNQPTPIIALVDYPDHEQRVRELTSNGEYYTPLKGSHQALYVLS